MHAIVQIAAECLLGAALGFFGGVLGIGGGLFAIPILGLVFGLDEQHAQGTAMLMVAPNVLLALVRYLRRGAMDRRVALILGMSAVPLTFVGATLAVHASAQGLRRAFAGFLVVMAVYTAANVMRSRAAVRARTPRSMWWAAPVGAIGGTVSGAFSVGGAVFTVPILAAVFALSQAAAQGLGLALVAPGTLVAIATYARASDIDWAIGVPLAAGGALFVGRGVDLAHRLPERTLRLIFCCVLLMSASGLFLRS